MRQIWRSLVARVSLERDAFEADRRRRRIAYLFNELERALNDAAADPVYGVTECRCYTVAHDAMWLVGKSINAAFWPNGMKRHG